MRAGASKGASRVAPGGVQGGCNRGRSPEHFRESGAKLDHINIRHVINCNDKLVGQYFRAKVSRLRKGGESSEYGWWWCVHHLPLLIHNNLQNI